ncbi:hypothetical protein [Mycolicibacterium sp.]|uniref:hypothetical protein n=1 Tax=Mycolicibacterium sp. TaxID=2320850 RepID=UPI00355CF887
MSHRFGFTGTRKGMSAEQRDWLPTVFVAGAPLHHGGCVGADAQMHAFAYTLVPDTAAVTVHPPINPKLRMPYDPRATWLPAQDYLDRDRDIVDASTLLLATPDGPRRSGSGTWYTVDYAVAIGRPVLICYPDGTVEPR